MKRFLIVLAACAALILVSPEVKAGGCGNGLALNLNSGFGGLALNSGFGGFGSSVGYVPLRVADPFLSLRVGGGNDLALALALQNRNLHRFRGDNLNIRRFRGGDNLNLRLGGRRRGGLDLRVRDLRGLRTVRAFRGPFGGERIVIR